MSFDATTTCCRALEDALEFTCKTHAGPYECPDVVIVRTQRGLGLPIHDGGTSFIEITYCPFCGSLALTTEYKHKNQVHEPGCGRSARGCVPGCWNYDPEFDG